MFSGKEGALLLVWLCYLMPVGVKGINIFLFYYLVSIVIFFEQILLMIKNKGKFAICGSWKKIKLSTFGAFLRYRLLRILDKVSVFSLLDQSSISLIACLGLSYNAYVCFSSFPIGFVIGPFSVITRI